MPSSIERFLRCFSYARQITHYYWFHVGADDASGQIRVESIRRVVEKITSLKIEILEVPFDGEIIKSMVEKYENHAIIYIKEGQPIEDTRYAAIKELCHLVFDVEPEYCEKRPSVTLKYLMTRSGSIFDDELHPVVVAEEMAEMLALEVIYPFEWREPDAHFLESGGSISELIAKRGVPAFYLEHACNPAYLEKARKAWSAINELIQSEKNA